jgi:hypothetical protein
MSEKFCREPCGFKSALRQARVSQLGHELVLYVQENTYKRWIRHKTVEPCGLDWIDYKQRKINRECWGVNRTKEIKDALKNLLKKNIIVTDSQIDKIRINYDYETWDI